jgi:hypothetical protein
MNLRVELQQLMDIRSVYNIYTKMVAHGIKLLLNMQRWVVPIGGMLIV